MTETTGAETLRRAAALMRERAEAATPGPWLVEDDEIEFNVLVDEGGPGVMYVARQFNQGHSEGERDAEHVASWHPDVALAVADWLDIAAIVVERTGEPTEMVRGALAVATAYLGGDA